MREDKGYREARNLLAERHGQLYKIASAYVDRVINGQSIHGEDGAILQTFFILLTSCSNTFRVIGYLNHLENPVSLRNIVERLPYPLRLKWRDLVDSVNQREGRDPNLKDIIDFVKKRSRVANHPIFGRIHGDQQSSNLSNQRRGAKLFGQQGQPPTPGGNSEEKPAQLKCPSRKRNHWLSQCDDFKKVCLNDCYKFVYNKNCV